IAAFDAAEADPATRAIVLTGAGDKAFCAGGDLQPDANGAPFTVDPSDPRNFIIRLFRRMEQCTLPIVARVNGPALAGGLGLLCACDLAVASSSARFGTPESGVGLFPMMILPYLQRVLTPRALMELCITGELFTAEEALAMGLVNYIAPPEELDAKTEWLLARIVNKSPTAVRLGKIGFHAMRDMTLDQAFDYAQLMLPMMAQSKDAIEGFAAFREKRKANWTGK
ncbi:enoyl-CoA hydratase-related protein, partial [Parvibaculum sp.]|uniref:enoyl-CoA hydratase-related protein n=1 Tax=Parvibaculum sp. TaxID=2024848 RepID=UPI002C5A7EEF